MIVGDGSSSDVYLQLFDANPARAAEKHEALRRRLIKFFEWRRCRSPEDLAQETMARVFAKLQNISFSTDDPAAYFFGCAKNLVHEDRKAARKDERQNATLDNNDWPESDDDVVAAMDTQIDRRTILQQRLQSLTPAERKLVVQYCIRNSDGRCRLSEELNLTMGNLRLQFHRLKERLLRQTQEKPPALQQVRPSSHVLDDGHRRRQR